MSYTKQGFENGQVLTAEALIAIEDALLSHEDRLETSGYSVLYTNQNLTKEQQAQARENIGAADEDTIVKSVNGITPDENGNVEVAGGSAVVYSASGDVIKINDSLDYALQGLTLYGKTTQNGTPTPDAPIDLVSAGGNGSIGVTVTDGTEYNVQVLAVSTPNGLPGIGNAVKDEMNLTSGKYVKRVGKLVFDGSADESWGEYTTASGSKRYLVNIPTVKSQNANLVANVLSNQLPATDANTIYTYDGEGCAINSTYLVFHSLQIQTLAKLKEHLSAKPLTVLFELATPVETDLPAGIASYATLHTYKPNTTIYNDAGSGMEVKYVIDTKTYIDKKFAELEELLNTVLGVTA